MRMLGEFRYIGCRKHSDGYIAFSHGCSDSPTTALVIQIPEEFNRATPVFAPGWSIEVDTEDLDEPITGGHGEEITERTSTVTFTADEPIENNIYAMVSVRLSLPEDSAGETIYFPVIQECEEGEHAWIEIPKVRSATLNPLRQHSGHRIRGDNGHYCRRSREGPQLVGLLSLRSQCGTYTGLGRAHASGDITSGRCTARESRLVIAGSRACRDRGRRIVLKALILIP